MTLITRESEQIRAVQSLADLIEISRVSLAAWALITEGLAVITDSVRFQPDRGCCLIRVWSGVPGVARQPLLDLPLWANLVVVSVVVMGRTLFFEWASLRRDGRVCRTTRGRAGYDPKMLLTVVM